MIFRRQQSQAGFFGSGPRVVSARERDPVSILVQVELSEDRVDICTTDGGVRFDEAGGERVAVIEDENGRRPMSLTA